MAARTTGKVKQTSSARASVKVAGAKKSAPRKASAKSAKTKTKAPAKSAKKHSAVQSKIPADAMATDMLVEQNEALRSELEHAQARIVQLEELNKNVVNRIDWVIDSLQSALKR